MSKLMISALVWTLTIASPAAAQTGAEARIDERVAALEARLSVLETELRGCRDAEPRAPSAAPAAIAPNPPPASPAERGFESNSLFLPSRDMAGGPLHYGGGKDRRIDVHAFLDLEYVDAGKDGARGGVSTFDNHHANVFVRSQLRENLTGHMELEFEHSGEVVEVDQAYLAWDVTDNFTFKGGRFYTPFGIERFVWYAPTNSLVSRPLAMRQIVPGNFYANGLAVSGIVETSAKDRFTYEAALSDGLGDLAATSRRASRQARDNNSSRALSGRLSYSRWPYFEIGASLHRQRYADDLDLDLAFLGLDLAARYKGFVVRAEWLRADVDRLPIDGGALEQEGWYAQLAYSFLRDSEWLPEWRLVGRWDEIDLDRARVGNDDRSAFSFGINAEIYNHFRIKAEYQLVDEDGPARDDDAFFLQLVIDY